MRRYLSESKYAKIAKVIFNIRAVTFDKKSWKQWNYVPFKRGKNESFYDM